MYLHSIQHGMVFSNYVNYYLSLYNKYPTDNQLNGIYV